MSLFKSLVERVKNPLRKKELSQTIQDSDVYVKDFLKTKEDNMASLKKKNPETVEKYLKKLGDLKKDTYFRSKIGSDKFVKLFTIQGFDFYFRKDDPILNTPSVLKIKRQLQKTIPIFLSNIKGVLPIRRPKFVIGEITEPVGPNKIDAAGYYFNRVIYIDDFKVGDVDLFVHEYAHYIADLIPTQTEPMLIREYENMLDKYFRSIKKSRRNSVDDTPTKSNEKQRMAIAKKLGFPSQYGLSNFDEFFAEIITHWKKMPNNVNTYRFKQIVKQVITRL